MDRNMDRNEVYVTRSFAAALSQYADEFGLSKSLFMREALRYGVRALAADVHFLLSEGYRPAEYLEGVLTASDLPAPRVVWVSTPDTDASRPRAESVRTSPKSVDGRLKPDRLSPDWEPHDVRLVLRLSGSLAAVLSEYAFQLGLSKSLFVRESIRRGLPGFVEGVRFLLSEGYRPTSSSGGSAAGLRRLAWVSTIRTRRKSGGTGAPLVVRNLRK